MKSLYLFPSLFTCGLFSLLGSQEAYADCVTDTTPGQILSPAPNYTARFGSQLNLHSRIFYTDCDHYVTDIDDYPAKRLTEENSDSHKSSFSFNKIYNEGKTTEYTVPLKSEVSASASISKASASSYLHMFGVRLGPYATASANFAVR